MDLKEQLNADLKEAMKSKDSIRKNVISLIRSSVKQVEIDEQRNCTDEDVSKIIVRQLKQRKDALESFRQAQRNDLVNQTNTEIDVLESYLPQPLSPEEMEELVDQAITETGAHSMKEMGVVMSKVMSRVQGRADGNTLKQLVQRKLSS